MDLGGFLGFDYVWPSIINAVYTDVNAGTDTINITSITLYGNRANEYIVVTPINNFIISGGITKAAGAWTDAPTLYNIENNIITLNPNSPPGNGQTLEYAISTSSYAEAHLLSWQSNLTFTDLEIGTTYYAYARSVENINYNAGNISLPSQPITSNRFIYTLSIADIADMDINLVYPSGLILSRSGTTTRSAAITVQNAGGHTIEWRYDGAVIETGVTINLSVDPFSSNYKINYDLIGHHTLTVVVWDNGVPFSRRIGFEVRQ
jgi:hypothetical protein